MENTYLNGGCSIAMFDCQRVDKGSYINGKTICEHGIFQPFLIRKEYRGKPKTVISRARGINESK
jgi:hypothetical protein